MADLFWAATEGQTSLLRQALEADHALVRKRDPDYSNRTLLHAAAAANQLDAVQLLLEHGADANASDDMGFSPLVSSVSSGSSAVARALLGAGADARATTHKGLTALHYAASKNRPEIARLLLEAGADVDARDSANQLPMHRAASVGATAVIQVFLSREAKPRLNLGDRGGNTPLMLAVESGHAETAVALIRAGADRQRTNAEGKRAEDTEMGVGGQEAKRVLAFIADECGPLED